MSKMLAKCGRLWQRGRVGYRVEYRHNSVSGNGSTALYCVTRNIFGFCDPVKS